jgi:hypothetical protein
MKDKSRICGEEYENLETRVCLHKNIRTKHAIYINFIF